MGAGRICDVEECERPHLARGWCSMHYKRWMKHGDPNKGASREASTIQEAFDTRTEQNAETGCLEWTGAKTSSGYGVVRFQGENHGAHRVAWTLVNGEIPEGLDVNHKCWNKSCVNVEHLNLATRSENVSYQEGPPAHNTSGARNVQWSKRRQCWFVRIRRDGREHHKYGFSSPEEAEDYAETLRKELNGKFAGKG